MPACALTHTHTVHNSAALISCSEWPHRREKESANWETAQRVVERGKVEEREKIVQ